MTCRAAAWFSGVDPAHASATTVIVAPASAAGRTVETTQQSVDTPVTTSSAASPTIGASTSHLPKVGASTTRAPAASNLKNGRARGVRFSTLAAICRELDCQPGDLLTYSPAD